MNLPGFVLLSDLPTGALFQPREPLRSESACPSLHAVVPAATPTAARVRGAGGGGAALPRLQSGAAGEESVRLVRAAEVRVQRPGRLAGGGGSAGRAAPRAGRSRREACAPCVRAECGPCELPT